MVMEDSSSSTTIKLTAMNYAIWKPRMEYLLYCKDLYNPLENEEKKLDAVKDADWKKNNWNTIRQIKQWIDHNVFYHIF